MCHPKKLEEFLISLTQIYLLWFISPMINTSAKKSKNMPHSLSRRQDEISFSVHLFPKLMSQSGLEFAINPSSPYCWHQFYRCRLFYSMCKERMRNLFSSGFPIPFLLTNRVVSTLEGGKKKTIQWSSNNYLFKLWNLYIWFVCRSKNTSQRRVFYKLVLKISGQCMEISYDSLVLRYISITDHGILVLYLH